jgi:tetratricopeptide (TPR) repeat protein
MKAFAKQSINPPQEIFRRFAGLFPELSFFLCHETGTDNDDIIRFGYCVYEGGKESEVEEINPAEFSGRTYKESLDDGWDNLERKAADWLDLSADEWLDQRDDIAIRYAPIQFWREKVKQIDYDKVIKSFTRYIEIEPAALTYMVRGRAYNEKGDYDNAIMDFTEAIKIKSIAIFYMYRGKAYGIKEDYDNAIADFTRAIVKDPAAIFYMYRGRVYMIKGDYDNAIMDFEDAIKIDPAKAWYYNVRAWVYYIKGDYDDAINDFTQALELDPDNEDYKKELEEAKAVKTLQEKNDDQASHTTSNVSGP